MAEMLNRLSHIVIGCAIEVHRALGPGLLESAYEECLAHELKMASLHFERQKSIALRYKTLNLECGYRLDFLVKDKLNHRDKERLETTTPVEPNMPCHATDITPPFSSPLAFVPSVPLW